MQTLVPIGTFEEKARKLLGKAGFDDLLEFLARRPKAGRIIQGTGGLRKLRFARPGKGKSGGARVIYYYHDDTKPILLLLIYAKADQDNLTNAQKAQLKKHVNIVIDEFS
ncbi:MULTISPECIES: type II toxin-antitoxin system RelE/ParE family toxin [Lentisalinibacter]|uniref:type II toxin-antitoxin system RelE/ParE family toxin n=1 Tax=Lentisalinibacter TaxID=3382081 RepID=UPI00386C7A58